MGLEERSLMALSSILKNCGEYHDIIKNEKQNGNLMHFRWECKMQQTL